MGFCFFGPLYHLACGFRGSGFRVSEFRAVGVWEYIGFDL